jgi:hypothetical protein
MNYSGPAGRGDRRAGMDEWLSFSIDVIPRRGRPAGVLVVFAVCVQFIHEELIEKRECVFISFFE